MSASTSSRVAKLKLGAEPKKVGVLVVLLLAAAIILLRNLGDDSGTSSVASKPVATPATRPGGITKTASRRTVSRNRDNARNGGLQLRPVDASRGDVDPTLNLDLLARLKQVKPNANGRNLFEAGQSPEAVKQAAAMKAVKIPVGPMAPAAPINQPPPAPPPIPLKFYGFERPPTVYSPNRGFFLDGDNIIVVAEGELVKQRYRIVKLQSTGAMVEDTVSKHQQIVPLTPEALGSS